LDRTPSSLGHCAANIQCPSRSRSGAICSWCQSASLALAIHQARRIQVAWDPRAPQQVRDGAETWIETQRQHPNLILTSSASPPQVPAMHRGKKTSSSSPSSSCPLQRPSPAVSPSAPRRTNPPCPLTAMPSAPPPSPSVHRPPRSAIAKFSQCPSPPGPQARRVRRRTAMPRVVSNDREWLP
jgi:hypothetical protein